MLDKKNNQEVEYGGCGERAMASFLDTLLFIVPSAIIYYRWTPVSGVFAGAVIVLFTIYIVKLVASEKQSTLGMRCFNLIIVNENMQRLSIAESLARFVLLGIINNSMYGLGILTALFREDKQGLHDILAKTYVIKK